MSTHTHTYVLEFPPPKNYDDHQHTHTNTPALARAHTHTHTNTHTQERGQEQGSEGQQIPLFLAARILRLGRKEVPDLMTPIPAEYHDKAASERGGGDRPTDRRQTNRDGERSLLKRETGYLRLRQPSQQGDDCNA